MTVKPVSVATAFTVATVGIAFYSVMDAVMKSLVLAIGAYNAMFWRMLVATLFGGIVYQAVRRGGWPSRSTLRVHLVRGVVSAAMALLFFWGLARVPLAQGIALAFVAPLIALYLAAVLLKERIERRTIYASLIGFAGVLVILAAQAEADMGPEAFRGALAILASALLYAYNIILMRRQALVARPAEVAFFMALVCTGVYLLAAPFLAVVPPRAEWPAIAGAAALGAGSAMLLSWAYGRAEAQYLAPVEYTAFVWAVLLGWIVFAEPVRPLTVIGAAMIVVGCLLAAQRRRPTAGLESAV